MVLPLILIALLIALNAFFAAAEIAIVSASRPRLRRLAEEGSRQASVALRLAQEPGRFLATVQVGVTLAGFLASAVGAVSAAALLAAILSTLPVPVVAERAGAIAIALVTAAIAFLSVVLGELAPKNLAVRNSESVSLAVAYPISWLERLAYPVVWLLNATTNLLLGGRAQVRFPSITSDEIVAIAEAAEQEGVIDEKEQQIVQGAFALGRRRVGELMVPRVDVKALSTEATLADARNLIVQRGLSRIPVFLDTIDDVVGVLHAKDLLAALTPTGAPAERKAAEIARRALFVPETVRADEVLREMQRQRLHLAVVIDEYGGTAGIVTLENLLEELVGPIRDEYDAAEQPEVRVVGDGEVIASGDADLDEVADSLRVRLEEQEVDTVGGLVYSALGRIPLVGDEVDVPGLKIEVLRMAGNRVSLVRLVRRPTEVT